VDIALSHYPLWAGLKKHIESHRLLNTGVYEFKTAVQKNYNSFKQGLHGNSCYTSELETNAIKTTWCQKIVLHGMNQVMANAFVGTRIDLAMKNLRQEKNEFPGLRGFRDIQNRATWSMSVALNNFKKW